MCFPAPPKTKWREGINQEKNGRDPLGGTNFSLDLWLNEIINFWGRRNRPNVRMKKELAQPEFTEKKLHNPG